MKNISKYTLLLIIVLVVSSVAANAQRGKKASDNDNKQIPQEENFQEPKVLIITAIERGPGVYIINIDAGRDRKGNERKLASNEREEQALAEIINNNSLNELLTVLYNRGYKLESAYALQGKEVKHYYILIKQGFNDERYENQKQQKQQAQQQQRSNQNRPQLSPEEIEKRKKMRERNSK